MARDSPRTVVQSCVYIFSTLPKLSPLDGEKERALSPASRRANVHTSLTENAMGEAVADKYRLVVERAFECAERGVSNITEDVKSMDGMSGAKTRHFYNNLVGMPSARYLEIGTWKGSSVCAAMCGNDADVLCIDNWSQFGGPKADFLRNFEAYRGKNRASFLEADCFSIDVSTLPKFNIYMYYGDHSEESHYRALAHFLPCLDDVFVYVVDDWNWNQIREGTRRAIRDLGLEVVYEREVLLTQDNTHTPVEEARRTWWNGIYVAVLKRT